MMSKNFQYCCLIASLTTIGSMNSAFARCDVDLILKNPHDVTSSSNTDHTYTVKVIQPKKLVVGVGVYGDDLITSDINIEAGEKKTKSVSLTSCGNYDFYVKWKTENGNEHTKVFNKDVNNSDNLTLKLEE